MDILNELYNINSLQSDIIFEKLMKSNSAPDRLKLLSELDNFFRGLFKIPYIRTLIIHDASDEWLSPMVMVQEEEAEKFHQDIEDIIFKRKTAVRTLDYTRMNVTVSFDERLITNKVQGLKLTPREFTAIYLHEIGHILSYKDYVSDMAELLNRELNRFGLNIQDKASEGFIKKWIKNKLTEYFSTKHSWYLRLLKEFKADDHSVRYGYGLDLVSGLDKIFKFLSKTYSKDKLTLQFYNKMKTDRFKSIESTMTDELGKAKTKEEYEYLRKQFDEIKKFN